MKEYFKKLEFIQIHCLFVLYGSNQFENRSRYVLIG